MLSGLTYNVQFGQQIDKIIDWLSHGSPSFDVICLQEFPLDYLEKFLTASFTNQYEYRTALSFNHKKKAYGQVTLVNKRKIQLVQADTLFLGTSFLEEHMLDFSGGRSALFTMCRYQNISFALMNTHLVAYGSNKQRRAQLLKIVTYFEQTRYKNMAAVVLGDFNYSSFIGQMNLLTLMQSYRFKNAYKLNTHKLLNFIEHQIDYLFYKNMHIRDVKIHTLPFSDHKPITFILELSDKRIVSK